MANVIDRDNGAKALRLRIKRMQSRQLSVGIHSDVASAEKEGTPGISLLEVATNNEFGTDESPERSFIRGYVDENESKIAKILKFEAQEVVKGKDPEIALARAGAYIRGGMQKRIADGIDPENAQSTIDRKGSDTPLIDKGQLRASIDFKVGSK